MSCKLCGVNHRGWERCSPSVVLTEDNNGVNKESSGVNSASHRKNDRHREGYMREYMAKRRNRNDQDKESGC